MKKEKKREKIKNSEKIPLNNKTAPPNGTFLNMEIK
jgi:hypothetical protein